MTEKVKKKDEKKTDRWYKDQPEWGTPESDKHARKMTPGQSGTNPVNEGMIVLLSAVGKFLKGKERGMTVNQIVNALTQKQLKDIVSKVALGSAKRSLSPSDYMLWSAAHNKLFAVNEISIPDLAKRVSSTQSLKRVAKANQKEKIQAELKRLRQKLNDLNKQPVKEEMMTAGDAGIPQDTKNMGPKLKTKVMVDRRYRKDKPPVLLKRFRKYVEDQNGNSK